MLRCQTRDNERRNAEYRHTVLNPGPAHRLDLDTVLRELEQFNALRRTEGRGAVSYGRYVAMRDGYIRISGPAAVQRGNASEPSVLPQHGIIFIPRSGERRYTAPLKTMIGG